MNAGVAFLSGDLICHLHGYGSRLLPGAARHEAKSSGSDPQRIESGRIVVITAGPPRKCLLPGEHRYRKKYLQFKQEYYMMFEEVRATGG